MGRRHPPQSQTRAGQYLPAGDDGVRLDGTKELIALADGFRESAESWADLLRNCKRRGMTAPVLAVGDGALGFWKALRDMFPDTCEQCWWHKMANVLAALPKPAHAGAKAALYNAEDLEHARKAATAFENDYGKKFPKAVAKITDDLDVLLEFYNYPAEHWIHPWSEPAPHSATANSTSTTTSTPEEAFAQVPEGNVIRRPAWKPT